jgi:hypothetical protein
MSKVSSNQDPFIPRKGQAAVVEYQRNHPNTKVLPVKLPGGYGKSDAIALSYQEKRDTGQVDRLLVVVANDVQLSQIQNEFAVNCRRIGFDAPGGVYPCDANHNALAVSRKNKAEVYVTTIQRVSSTNRRADFDMLRMLLQDGHKWMLAADEYHHYSTGNDWGIALSRLVSLSVFTIATSATPGRDGEPTIFGDPLVKVTYKQAVAENAVKSMELRYWDYRVVAEDIPSGQTVEFTTDQLRQEIGTEDVDVFMQKRNLRFHPDYVNPVLQGAINALLVDKLNLHPCAQLLVRALSCNHAKVLCDQINSYASNLSCDWIGTKSEYHGRPDEENAAVIKRFCPPKDANGIRPNPSLDILVEVNMAGEGTDTVMVSELADLSLVALKGNPTQTKQFVLRGARWIRGGDPQYQVCQFCAGKDHPIWGIPNFDLMEWLDSNKDFNAAGQPGTTPPPPAYNVNKSFVDPDPMKGFHNLKEVELIAVSKNAWKAFYESMEPVKTGIVSSLIARGAAQVMRLSMLYAVLDKTSLIEEDHLKAAAAFWDYCSRGARWIFGLKTGHRLADKIFWAIGRRSNGMTRSEIKDEVCHRNYAATDLEEALSVLRDAGLAEVSLERSGQAKRPAERWRVK